MDAACGDPAEPDLVLAVVPPVPRRLPWPARHQPAIPEERSPTCRPDAAVPVVSPPAVPESPSPFADAFVVAHDGAPPDVRPDRRWWASTAVSTVVHVVVLTILAVIVAKPERPVRARPFEIRQLSADPDPVRFTEPEELAVVEIEPADPGVGPVVDEPMLVEVEAADADMVAFSDVDAAAGVAELDPAGLVARIGGGGGGGPSGGFGGDVGRRLAAAGARSGEIQVSLAWNDFNDLDLHVVTPAGERIFFAHRVSRCRGTLDVDMNASGPATREPVENVYWPAKRARPGEYGVFVHHFARHDRDHDDTAFTVHVLVDGVRREFTGSVRAGDAPVAVIRFTKAAAARRGDDEFVE